MVVRGVAKRRRVKKLSKPNTCEVIIEPRGCGERISTNEGEEMERGVWGGERKVGKAYGDEDEDCTKGGEGREGGEGVVGKGE